MITDYYISPHPSLQPFINNYILSTSGDEKITFGNQWPASHETSLIFNLANKPRHATEINAVLFSSKDVCVVGLQTKPNGFVHFSGRYHTFIIQFTAVGFNKVFGIPMQELKDKIYSATDIIGQKVADLYDRLLHARDVQKMADFTDEFLLSFLKRNNNYSSGEDGITAVSKALYNTTQVLSVLQYASKANMSLRNFERRFTEQVGVPPKLFTKLVRFNEAMIAKLIAPEKNWTSIAYEYGYFDQMHFIKEFKQFTGFTPTQFSQHQRGLTNLPADTNEWDTVSWELAANPLQKIQFVVVKRTDF